MSQDDRDLKALLATVDGETPLPRLTDGQLAALLNEVWLDLPVDSIEADVVEDAVRRLLAADRRFVGDLCADSCN